MSDWIAGRDVHNTLLTPRKCWLRFLLTSLHKVVPEITQYLVFVSAQKRAGTAKWEVQTLHIGIWCFRLSNFMLISAVKSLCIWMGEVRCNSWYCHFSLLGKADSAKITWLCSWTRGFRWNIFLNNHTKLHVFFGRLQISDIDESLKLWPLSQAQALIPLMRK